MSNQRMPVFFMGHGSPMNAILKNDFTDMLKRLAKELSSVKTILVVSAHWQTEGTFVTAMDSPKTIHDFYGFPESLYKVNYPTKGDPELAKNIKSTIIDPDINLDFSNWGLDHGSWSLLFPMFPEAKTPVLQLSLAMNKSLAYHFNLGKQLSYLRNQGVLIIGSGNIVHNLKEINWEPQAKEKIWALQFDDLVKKNLEKRDFDAFLNEMLTTESGRKSHPTLEHYLPLLYILGSAENSDKLQFLYEGIEHSSISMTSFGFY